MLLRVRAGNWKKPQLPNAQLAQDALRYKGAGYQFGGSPANGIGKWDCSSFLNWCAGHDLGMAIPGYAAGTYDGKSHGPVVVDWATWTGATTIPSPSAGDLCVWPGIGPTGHIGIALGSGQMISALNTRDGTIQTPIQGYGPAGVPLIYRSINAGANSGTVLTSAVGSKQLAQSCAEALIGTSGLIGLAGYAIYRSIRKRRL